MRQMQKVDALEIAGLFKIADEIGLPEDYPAVDTLILCDLIRARRLNREVSTDEGGFPIALDEDLDSSLAAVIEYYTPLNCLERVAEMFKPITGEWT